MAILQYLEGQLYLDMRKMEESAAAADDKVQKK